MSSTTEIPDGFPQRGRLLGIDFGTKRVGVAVSDVFQEMASPLRNYQRIGRQADEHFFHQLATEYEVVGFVVGLPFHMSGDESGKCKEARHYGKWLSRVTGCPTAFQDERHSSVQAEGMLLAAQMTSKQRKSRLDKVAAQILLQAFLDAVRNVAAATEPHGHSDTNIETPECESH